MAARELRYLEGTDGMAGDTRFKWLLIALTASCVFSLSRWLGLTFPSRDLVEPLVVVISLGLVAAFYQRRGLTSFVSITTALMLLVAYTFCFTTLMYAACAINRPLVDDSLVACDAVCGIHLPAIVAWAEQAPFVRRILAIAYNTMLPQTAFVIALLGFADRRRELQDFLRQFMLGSWLVLLLFALWPAAGPFVAYGYEPSPDQARYLEHFWTLRSGERAIVTWRSAEGLITFPSFHTTWAILLAYAVRHRRALFIPSMLLNLGVIASTMTTGWHYFADVLSGTAVAALAILVSHVLEVRLSFAETLRMASRQPMSNVAAGCESLGLMPMPAAQPKT